MAKTASLAPRRIAAEDLNVSPDVQAFVLAAPKRRLRAMIVDMVVVLLAGAILLPASATREDDEEEDADAARPTAVIAPKAASTMTPAEAVSMGARMLQSAASATAAAEAAKAHRKAERLARAASASPVPTASGASTPGSAPAAGDEEEADTDEGAAIAAAALAELPREELVKQVESLQRKLARARKPQAWYDRAWRLLHGLVTGYGVSLLYFTLLPAFWRGQTLGKRMMGLRIVEITGKPITLRLAFTRYGGYVAGLVTGGFGLAQLLWDRNRQGLQDKVAHTVVVDERETSRLERSGELPALPPAGA